MTSPAWLDRAEYPFVSRWLDLPAGRMHYVDEGQGPPVVFVHGTPDWSFAWRHLIKALSPGYRCIAPDNLGFGLSDKPQGYSYAPAEQAANLRRLIEHLGLRDITLVLHDFGGPFGLAYAIEKPANVKRLVLMNTWMWSLGGDRHHDRFGRLFGGALGRFLYLRLNFPVRVMMKQAILDQSRFPRRIQEQYARPLGSAAERVATHAYARALLGAGEWYDALWRRREKIRDIPAMIVWGMSDLAFRQEELDRLQTVFSRKRTACFHDAGHFPHEERSERVVSLVEEFLST
jgi:pimeloyl-ACP methyl ester carboxylesterase